MDEVHGPFAWTSVVVKGTVYFISGVARADDPKEYRKALDVLRRLVPETMTPQDPTPSRNAILRISVNEVQGRASQP